MDFFYMKADYLDGVLVVEVLYGLRSILRCIGWSFHGCYSLGLEAVFEAVSLPIRLLGLGFCRFLQEKYEGFRTYKLIGSQPLMLKNRSQPFIEDKDGSLSCFAPDKERT